MGQIYLIRHGQASFGSENYDELSALGHEQARLLGEWFANGKQQFHRIVTGDLKRHRQTANACIAVLPMASRVDLDWQTDPGFNEYDHHEVMIRHRPEFDDPAAVKHFFATTENARYVFQQYFQESMARWMSGEHDADYREPWSAFRTRVVSALQRLIESAGQSQSIAVFTSGGTISTIAQHLLGLPDQKVAELNWSLVNCAITKLLYRRGAVSLSYLNNFAHLEWLGQPESVTYR
ncbi:histidine phosphatase family protein [Noviherbaspirillum cavernae]|uniref:Histidine phosphatase family protein n=1 Tax=Noviherbaspirillum cavernae TaxID=2320862 RepID=A0A418X2Z2_9BURK|nr:histidine phosphatase family protein [Noviherbaspirillum cavernae]RJG06819.1 histidine phosphatase family protein [Noviherbaspirillum cavernae]